MWPEAVSVVMLGERSVLPTLPTWLRNQPPPMHQNLSGGEKRHCEVTADRAGALLGAC